MIEGGSAGGGLSAATIIALVGLADGLDQGDLADVEVPVERRDPLLRHVQFPAPAARAGLERRVGRALEPRLPGPHFTTKIRHPLASMVYAPNLASFPPAYLSCGHDDSFLGHTLEFTKALALAGARATLSVPEGLDHGYAKSWTNAAAQREVERAFAWLDEKVPVSQPV